MRSPGQGSRFQAISRKGWSDDPTRIGSDISISRSGSCGELRTQIYIGVEIGYIDKEQGRLWIAQTREISAMLIGLRNNLTDH
ncbi:four helix bundle protein [Thiocystis minor]|uniref:four helix bundle protein n=1 Tax=Thiocystis minor TaxID=61597 RepID=UPI003B83552A